MTAPLCGGSIDLFGRIDVCELESGHQGAHENTSYGPTIHWTANNYWATSSSSGVRS